MMRLIYLGQAVFHPAARESAQIMPMFHWMFWITVPVYIAVIAFLLAAILRRRGADGAGNSQRGMRIALAFWIGIVAAGLLALNLRSFFVDRALARATPGEPVHIEIVAKQWWWQVKYTDGDPTRQFETANELHLPIDRPALLTLESPDVIHSLWMPNLMGKQDLIPGRVNYLRITPTRAGEYRGQCAEFCGLQHAHMALTVTVDSEDDFARWRERRLRIASAPRGAMQREGYAYFMNGGCALCHRIDGTEANGKLGPNLTHIASRPTLAAGMLPNDAENLASWLRDPQRVKPGCHMPAMGLSDIETRALVAYLDNLQ